MGLLGRLFTTSKPFLYRLGLALGLICLSVLTGVVGFMLIADYNLLEAFYMTIITISTVGFNEVKPLTPGGQLFVAFLIITNIGIFTYAISTIAAFIIEGQFRSAVKNVRLEQEIAKLENHTIVCGFGRNGYQACEELAEHKQKFVVIEYDQSRIEQITDHHNYLVINGDATRDEVLLKAGIQKAKAVMACLPKDADNVFVVLTAREINNKLKIISRASDESSEIKLRRAGADRVIMPEKIGGSHMAKMIIAPDIIDFFTLLSSHGGVSVNFEEIDIHDLNPNIRTKTISDLELRKNTGANVIGLKQKDGSYVVNPDAATVLDGVFSLILLGDEEQLQAFRNYILKYE